MESASRSGATTLTLSLASPPVAWAAFTASGRFALLQSSVETERLKRDSALRNAKLSQGDLLLIWTVRT